ncbi:hypothetical protein AK830_g3789 [Neonectria ditissima]|uniref:MYND-type domain-containing protein n=1 Tax=Neonectria ditissima TaxID=78410 RepID=A0A0P7AXP5_9HYPO|nr:hypothetical protein AK830_g3789 [Neonectria ditissima]
MDAPVLCTICGSSDARRCVQCHSAAYCSIECQQTDWRTHRILCRKFAEHVEDNFASRPSPWHYLAIYFPMAGRRPCLIWVDSRIDAVEGRTYFYPVLDHLLHIPGNDYIGRGLRQVRGNILRGREQNQDTLHLWFLDPDVTPHNITINRTIHGTPLIADTWGEFTWNGPLVAVMRAGSDFDPRHATDITLTAYRDAIDYLGFYMDTIGSMIDGPGRDCHRSNIVLARKISKATGVRINCRRDQAIRAEPEMVEVSVPRMHPLFNLESDDPCDIPSLFGLELVAKAYDDSRSGGGNSHSLANNGLANPLAQLLLIRTSIQNGSWVHLPSYWSHQSLGSLLFVDRSGRNIRRHDITEICNLIEEVAVPFILKENASEPGMEQKLKDILKWEGSIRGIGR